MSLIQGIAFTAILGFLFIDKNTQAQSFEKPSADELFDQKNYIEALVEFKKLEKEFPEDADLKHRMGVCYLKIYNDKSLAIPYLEYSYKNEKYKNELLLELANAYQFAYRLDDAIKFYNKYREKAATKIIPQIDHYIETCENAKALMKKPVNVSFENVGKEINTKYADYYPFVTKDEETLFFTSRRDQNTGKLRSYNGYYTSDVYTSKVEKGGWTRAKNMGALINTMEDEECVGISPDGKNLIVYVDNVEFPGDLFHAEMLKSKQFSKTTPFNEPVNSDQLDAEACYGSDNNTLFFVSARKGGLGEEDIYMTNRLPNGEWGIPKNLGTTINTPYREAFPVVSEDGKTLFFSSQGHTSMGGYDIFRSRWDENAKAWSKPVNVGYPLNTTDDDMMFSIAKNGRDGYISAWRKEGLGDLDIYKITFNDVDKPLTAISGMVILSDTTKQEIDAFVSITNLKTKEEVDSKNVNKKTGKYIFIVEPGKYQIQITTSGNKTIKEDLIVYDKSDFTSLIEKKHLIGGQEQPVIVEPKKRAK